LTDSSWWEELRDDLRALKIAPPYVLVGHSLGGTYMQLYAQRHPEEIAGLVLVDSRHADFTDRCPRGPQRRDVLSAAGAAIALALGGARGAGRRRV
jgi:pimeloyl-ACP methyl ester carboxylesterase